MGHSKSDHQPLETIPENLFDVLPFREADIADPEENKPYIVTTYLPDGTFHHDEKGLKQSRHHSCYVARGKVKGHSL